MTVELKITGKVQGVGYRYFVQKNARALGLTGWVKNNKDGSVICVATGGEETLENLRQQCEVGPPAAEVQNVATKIIPDENFDGFVIKRG